MIGRNGVPRIQEETADTVRVWTHEEWQVELKRRQEIKNKPDNEEVKLVEGEDNVDKVSLGKKKEVRKKK